jgi:general secretion pathway protein G
MTRVGATQTNQGFTIVELLIVIVIIAILAAITIIAYNGVQGRATFAREQSDLKTLTKALELYKVDNSAYPITTGQSGCTYNWCGWDQATGDSFIVGLSPKYISKTPQMPSALGNGDTYLYQSNGTDYELIRYKNDSQLPAAEITNNPLLAVTDGYNPSTGVYFAWGYRTNTDNHWW